MHDAIDALILKFLKDETRTLRIGFQKIPSPEAKKIANGHAWDKHVIEKGEYPELSTRAEFESLVDDVMTNPSASKNLANGRKAWWSDSEKTVVIQDPNNPDGGTAFRPTAGETYYDNLN